MVRQDWKAVVAWSTAWSTDVVASIPPREVPMIGVRADVAPEVDKPGAPQARNAASARSVREVWLGSVTSTMLPRTNAVATPTQVVTVAM